MWIGRQEFDYLVKRVENAEKELIKVQHEVFEYTTKPSYLINPNGQKIYCGDEFAVKPFIQKLKDKIELLLKELGYEYKPETQTKEPAKLVKTIGKSKRAKK